MSNTLFIIWGKNIEGIRVAGIPYTRVKVHPEGMRCRIDWPQQRRAA